MGRIVLGKGACGVALVSSAEAKRLKFPIPAEIIVVIVYELLSRFLNLNDDGVKVVGL